MARFYAPLPWWIGKGYGCCQDSWFARCPLGGAVICRRGRPGGVGRWLYWLVGGSWPAVGLYRAVVGGGCRPWGVGI